MANLAQQMAASRRGFNDGFNGKEKKPPYKGKHMNQLYERAWDEGKERHDNPGSTPAKLAPAIVVNLSPESEKRIMHNIRGRRAAASRKQKAMRKTNVRQG